MVGVVDLASWLLVVFALAGGVNGFVVGGVVNVVNVGGGVVVIVVVVI